MNAIDPTKFVKLVHKTALRMNVPYLQNDLLGEGMVALVKAAEVFEPSRGPTFGLFAKICIRRAMITFLRREGRRQDTRSLEEKDTDGIPYKDSVGDDGQVDRIALRDELQFHLHPVEEWVIVKRFFDKEPFDTIAEQLGFDTSRVSLIYKNAIDKLRVIFEGGGESVAEGKPNDVADIAYEIFMESWQQTETEGE